VVSVGTGNMYAPQKMPLPEGDVICSTAPPAYSTLPRNPEPRELILSPPPAYSFK